MRVEHLGRCRNLDEVAEKSGVAFDRLQELRRNAAVWLGDILPEQADVGNSKDGNAKDGNGQEDKSFNGNMSAPNGNSIVDGNSVEGNV